MKNIQSVFRSPESKRVAATFSSLGFFLWLAAAASAATQTPNWEVAERGPHHRVWQRVVERKMPSGRVLQEKQSYTELGSGMHYWENGQWVESQEVIEILADGALARRGPIQAVFAANLNTRGAISLFTPDKQRLTGHVLGLAYTDSATGQSVLLAGVQDCLGELHPPHQVLYPDAFAELKADVTYTYRRDGFEQDVILHEMPPSPALYGLDPASTRLEVWTEFIEAPEPSKTVRALPQAPQSSTAPGTAIPPLLDEDLDFGAVKMGPGAAFLEKADPAPSTLDEDTIPSAKTWLQLQGRTLLIEAVEYPRARERMEAGRLQAAVPSGKTAPSAHPQRLFPEGPMQATAEQKNRKLRPGPTQRSPLTASLDRRPSFTIDYSVVLPATNLTFQADTTYYVTNVLSLSGTTVIEGGTVIKFSQSAAGRISIYGPLVCRTSPWLPAVFTSRDDDTVGQTIEESTGNPTNRYGNIGLYLAAAGSPYTLHDLRLHRFSYGIAGAAATVNLTNVQILNTLNALRPYAGTFYAGNLLLRECHAAFACLSTTTNTLEHGTLHYVTNFVTGSTQAVTVANTLMVGVLSNVIYQGTCVLITNGTAPLFETAVGGSYYLTSSSALRETGTTNINPGLLATLKNLTTYPPVTLSNALPTDTILAPVVARNTGFPDLGWHYAPLDYLVSGVNIASNVTVLLTNGAAVGIHYAQTNWGFKLDAAHFISQGSPLRPNRIVRAHCVQEQSIGTRSSRELFSDNDGFTPQVTPSSELRFRFTESAQLADDGYFLLSGRGCNALEWTHSQVRNPALVLDLDALAPLTCGLTNTLWERGGAQFGLTNSSSNTTVHSYNNLFRTFYLHLVDGQTNWSLCNNLFDTAYAHDHGSPVLCVANAFYHTTNTSTILTNGLTLTNLVYASGPLGDYYQPANSPLRDAGSTNAHLLGLYHFTTTTNQVKETNSIVDIGLHYVAVTNIAGMWQSVDTEGDGLPDYAEDSNGNGSREANETSFTITDTDGDGVSDYLEYLLGRSGTVNGATNDPSGQINLKVFTPLK